MTRYSLSLALIASLTGCMRTRSLAPMEDDKSIIFPQFFENSPISVGEHDAPYELDGQVVHALALAANDYLPQGDEKVPCSNRQEAQFYRVIRKGDIIFIYIYENHAYCGRQYPARESGAKYAISTDGRILRRVLDGLPDSPPSPAATAPEDGGFSAELGVSPTFEATWNAPRDGGTGPADAGSPPTP